MIAKLNSDHSNNSPGSYSRHNVKKTSCTLDDVPNIHKELMKIIKESSNIFLSDTCPYALNFDPLHKDMIAINIFGCSITIYLWPDNFDKYLDMGYIRDSTPGYCRVIKSVDSMDKLVDELSGLGVINIGINIKG